MKVEFLLPVKRAKIGCFYGFYFQRTFAEPSNSFSDKPEPLIVKEPFLLSLIA
jgi:hypothetical protein